MPRRLLAGLLVAGALLVAAPASSAAASVVECGQLGAYTAPDPIGPADGSLTMGLLAPWVVASDATLSAAIQSSLASAVGSGPTCLQVDRDGADRITALDFAASGSIVGPVVEDAGLPGYILADRLLIPGFVTDAYPGLAAAIVTSASSGTDATATLDVDVATGRITGVEAIAHFCGAADLAGNGDGLVGAATIPGSVLDATATARLANANGAQACADVDAAGPIDGSGNLTLTTDVVITLAASATPPNTATQAAGRGSSNPGGVPGWLLIGGLAGAFSALRGSRRARDSRPL